VSAVVYDRDFPPPAPDHSALRRDVATEYGCKALEACATVSPEGAAWAAYDFLAAAEAGLPYRLILDDAARDDARFWAETATPHELEAYALAAMDRLAPAPFVSRQIKRLVAALWGRMSPAEQSAFREWINKK
jgi:hypothetical protein